MLLVVRVVAEERRLHPRQWRRRDDDFGRELRPRVVAPVAPVAPVVPVVPVLLVLRVLVLLLLIVVAFVAHPVGAQLAHAAVHLLPVRLRGAGVVRQSVDVQADTYKERRRLLIIDNSNNNNNRTD